MTRPADLKRKLEQNVRHIKPRIIRELSAGVRKLETVTLCDPVMPITDGFIRSTKSRIALAITSLRYGLTERPTEAVGLHERYGTSRD
jgi:hypothetical protein